MRGSQYRAGVAALPFPAMEYRVLGPLELSGPRGRIALEGRRERAVLAALVLGRGGVVSTDRLLDAVWGDAQPRSAAKTVQNHVLRLRKALGAGAIETRDSGYRLVVAPGDIDVDRFELLVRDGRTRVASGDAEGAVASFRDALALWRGRPFDELDSCTEAAAEAVRLCELERTVSEELIAAELACGHHREVVSELEAMVAEDPLREGRWAMLMLALYRSGRQADALRTYQRVRTLLGDELGIEPGSDLRALELAIATQDEALALPLNREEPSRGDSGLMLVLVAELAGADRLEEFFDDDGRAEPPGRVTEVLREQLTDAGGRALGTSGDLVIFRFTSASRCLEAALDLRRSIGVIAPERGAPLAVRVGIHAGESTRDGTGDILGTPVDIARGLCRAAAPGQILTSDLVRDLVGSPGEFGFEELAPVAIEGLDHRVAAVEVLAADEDRPPNGADCPPYKGLESFEPEDADIFCGREVVVGELVARLRGARFLAVVGASGSGKSSVVRAGLVAAIKGGAVPGSQDWPMVLMTPTADPLRELARQWSAVAGVEPDEAQSALVGGPNFLRHWAAAATAELPMGARAPLVIDQFEELFTLCRDDEARRLFIDALVAAVQPATAPIAVVVVLRADFYGHCAAYPELRRLMEGATFLLGPMDPPELLAAIDGPATAAGILLEPGLSELVVRDVVDEPGALPLLSHALLETWKRRERRTMTVDGYLATGGVNGAIATTAEFVYSSLDAPEQEIARSVFLRLTQPGDGTEDTRRRTSLGELLAGPQAAKTKVVLETLADARLVTVDAHSAEVAHEAVIREWPRLRGWLDEDREGLRIHRHLTYAARDWDSLSRDDAELYRGPRLATAREWLARDTAAALNEVEVEFLAESVAREDAEMAHREERARQQVRANRRLKLLLSGTAIALVVALVAGVFAWVQRRHAGAASAAARAATVSDTVDGILSASAALGSENRSLQSLLLLEANRLRPGALTDGALFSALREEPRLASTIPVRTDALWVAPDGRSIVVLTKGRLERWDAKSARLLDRYPFRGVTSAAMSSAGTLAVATDKTIEFADLSGRPLGRPIAITTRAFSLSFSPDGARLAVASGVPADVTIPYDQVPVREYDVATSTVLDVQFAGHTRAVSVVAFSPDGSDLATGGNDGLVVVHDARTGATVGTPIHMASFVRTLEFDPIRSRLAIGTGDAGLSVEDWQSGEMIGKLEGPIVSTGDYSADGGVLAVSGTKAVDLYDANTLQPTADAPFDVQSGAAQVALAGGRIFVGGESGPATVWVRAGADPVVRSVPHTESYVFPMPGGRVLAAPDMADSVSLLDAKTLRPLGVPLSPGPATQHGIQAPATFAASYYDSHRIAVINRDGVLQLYDVGTRRSIGQPLDLGFPTIYAVFSRDMREIAIGGRAGEVTIVDVSGRQPRVVHSRLSSVLTNYVVSLEFGPHGELFAADSGHAVMFEQLRTRRPVVRDLAPITRGSATYGMGADLSPDGRTIAVAHGGTIALYDAVTLRPEGAPIPTLNAPIGWLQFDRSGRRIVADDTGANVRMVDAVQHQPIGPSWIGLTSAGSVFSHDGTMVGTSTAGSAALLSVDPAVWRREACRVAGRNLTVAEWRQFLPGQGPRRRTCPQYP